MESESVPPEQHKHDTVRAMEVTIRLGLAFGLVVWCFEILRPFISTIVWAMIIAAALYPVYTWFKAKIRKGPGLSAFAFTAAILVALMTPTFMLSGTLIGTAREYADELQDGSLHVPPPPERVKSWPFIGDDLYNIWHLANQNLTAALEKFEEQLKDAAGWLIKTATGAGLGILQFALAVIISGIFLAYSEGGGDFARLLGRRLAGDQGEQFAKIASSTVRNVAQGVLGVAFIQAIMAGIGFMAADVPGAGLWTLLVLIMATVQLPTGLILIPSIFYVASVAGTGVTIIYGIWMVVVSLSDNVLKPILLGRGSSQPMAVIFLGAIGGFILSGIVGLFVGAVVLALGYDLFMLWLHMDEPEKLPEGLKVD